jgi:hypothetical protein
MKQIKTVHHRIDDSAQFDKEVNDALTEGWQLTRREFVPGYVILYAELEREVITEAEKCCENCRYCEVVNGEPCDSCSEDANKWEPYS